MKTIVDLYHWIKTNPGLVLLIIYIILNVAVAVTPKRFQEKKWFGVLLVIAHRVSVLRHGDQTGTIQWPLIAKAILFGAEDQPKSSTSGSTPDHSATP